jgi:hypothetical protein
MTFWKPEYANIGGLGDPTARYPDEYAHKTYGAAQFHIPDGMYSIEEIEKLLVEMKAAEKQTEKSLERVIKPYEEKK